jgi:hypothetical protein
MSTSLRVIPDGVYHLRFGREGGPGGLYATAPESSKEIRLEPLGPKKGYQSVRGEKIPPRYFAYDAVLNLVSCSIRGRE